MGSHFNFKGMGGGDDGGRPPGNLSLTRQPSIYSLTFEEFQNAMGGFGKDFGSMNMDEFLKNVWSAEETQVMGSAFGGGVGGAVAAEVPAGGNLQRQGSLTLPRTLSQKTVDEVWKDLFKESEAGKEGNVNGGVGLTQRQQTLGEMTLEEFLVRAGVVREDAQAAVQADNGGFYNELVSPSNTSGLTLGFGQPSQTNGVLANLMTDTNNNNIVTTQSPNLAIGINGVRFQQQQQQQQLQQQQQRQLQQNQEQKQQQQLQQQQRQLQQQNQEHKQQQQQRPQQLFPKQTILPHTSPMNLGNGQLTSPGARSSIMGISNPIMNNTLLQGGGLQGGVLTMPGLGATAVTVATSSPVNQLSDGIGRSNGDLSSLSPVPYSFNGGLRGRRSGGTVEKVVERRQRRMIKNRESAARSRARKQAYTMELESELAKLREQNEELQKKQAELMEQKLKMMEMMNQQKEPKRRCLRRTHTGPW